MKTSDDTQKIIKHLNLLIDISNRVADQTAHRDTAFTITYSKLLELDPILHDLLVELLVNADIDQIP